MARGKVPWPDLAREIISVFADAWSARYGRRFLATFNARDIFRLREVYEARGLDFLIKAIYNFIADDNRWLVDNVHPLRVLLKSPDEWERRKGHGKGQGANSPAICGHDGFESVVRSYQGKDAGGVWRREP